MGKCPQLTPCLLALNEKHGGQIAWLVPGTKRPRNGNCVVPSISLILNTPPGRFST